MPAKIALSTCALMALLAAIELFPGATAGAQKQAPVRRVIVVLKNQAAGLPATRSDLAARRAALRKSQAPVTSQLAASGAKNVHASVLLNAIAATVSSAEESRLRANPAVSEVVPDQAIHLAPPPGTGLGGASRSGATGRANACAPSGQVQLNPQALQAMHADSQNPSDATARKLGFDGSGVTVGFIADGLDVNNPDFIAAGGRHVFVDYRDFSGEGTAVATGGEEAFGDASSIAAQGRHVYDVAGYGPNAVTAPCKIRIEGVAPGASLVGLDIFGAEDAGFNSSFLQAIDYAVTVDHVNVLNESLGNNYYPDDSATLDLIKRANDAAVAAGTTVTVSSGDAGVTDTIGTPSTDPNVIATGASTTYRLFLQAGYGGAQLPGITGWRDGDVGSLSSGGFEQDARTIDVVAPGELNWALCSTNAKMYSECVNYAGKPTPIIPFGGTSESAPLTAGVAALVIQAYQKTHGTAPTPQVVKQVIAGTADDIGSPADQQGAGLVDAYKAVLAAESYRAPGSHPTPSGETLIESATQLNAVDQPNTPQTLHDTVTNTGASPQTITLSTRTIGAYRQIATTQVTLSDASSPKTTDWAGTPSNYEPIKFNVPGEQARLNASIAFQSVSMTDLHARVRLTLVDPRGELAAYSVPQGDGNYGNVQITNPAGGTWTAYVWSREGRQGGTQGPVRFGAQVAGYAPFGRVTPSALTLAPGQSAPVQLAVSTPAQPGDSSGAIVLSAGSEPSFGRQTTIPVTLRSLIRNGPESFVQTLTGGNGRSSVTGQTFYYQLDVPPGQPELNAAVQLADNPNNPFTMFLVGPSGEALAEASNQLPNPNPPGYTNQLGASAHVLSPASGAWTLIVAFIPQVSGTALTEPFTVSTSQSAVPASASGLPNSAATTLAAGQPQTYAVKVTNPGPAPEAYFVDARLPTTTQLDLTALNNPDTTVPLTAAQNLPAYLVPTHTTQLVGTAGTTGPTPIRFDASAPAGDPDMGSTVGSSALGSLAANPIAPGVWSLVPDVVGAFGVTGAPNEPVHTTMTTTSNAFDASVSADTGDMWQAATDPSVLNGFSPVIVGPGQTATIPVTITPQGPAGARAGTLYIDSADLFQFQVLPAFGGSELAAIPYRYSVR
jgi:hypothetical protein